MDPDMIRPRKCKPCPPPPPPPPSTPPPSPKNEVPPPPSPPSLRENAAQPCQKDCCSHYGHLPFSPLAPPPLWPRPLPPQLFPPPNVRSYWNDDLNQLSRARRVESLEMGYRLNFRDPLDDLYEDHTLRRHTALHSHSHSTPRRALPPSPPLVRHHHHGPPLMGRQHHGPLPLVEHHHHGAPLMGRQHHGPLPLMEHHHHRPPPRITGHHRDHTPLLLGHHHGPPTSYYSPPVDYEHQYGYYGCDNPNGCTTM